LGCYEPPTTPGATAISYANHPLFFCWKMGACLITGLQKGRKANKPKLSRTVDGDIKLNENTLCASRLLERCI